MVSMEWLTGKSAQKQFDEFVDEVTDDLIRTGYLLTWDLAETEDLVQETLFRLSRHWTRVRGMDYPIAYARRVLVNLVIDGKVRRGRRNEELRPVGDNFEGPVDESAPLALRVLEDASEFRAVLAALPRRQRTIIVLRYWTDLREAEIALLLGCSVGTVKSTLSRGVAQLRQRAGSDEPRGHALPNIHAPSPPATKTSEGNQVP
jgi:RNA polymerase sigma-70 factor (sigma-E family)